MHGYEIVTACHDGEEALAAVAAERPDLILLDVMMPKLDGLSVPRLRADPSLRSSIILVTARTDTKDVVGGLEAGADEYRPPGGPGRAGGAVQSMLQIKALRDTVREQAGRLEAQAGELAAWNRSLEERVLSQVEQLERVGRLKRYLAPQVAEADRLVGGQSQRWPAAVARSPSCSATCAASRRSRRRPGRRR